MLRNNLEFGKDREIRNWDLFSIFIFCMVIAAPGTYPVVFTAFFAFHPNQTNFLYSVLDTSNLSITMEWLVFLIFCWIELVNMTCAAISFSIPFTIVAAYYLQISHWLTAFPNLAHESKKIHRNFQRFSLYTLRFNGAFSSYFLAPVKDIIGSGFVFTSFSLIRYHSILGWSAIFMLGLTLVACVTILLILILPGAWVWKSSTEIKDKIISNVSLTTRVSKSLRLFGITIGPFYVIKNYTVITFFDILVSTTCSLLIAFKE